MFFRYKNTKIESGNNSNNLSAQISQRDPNKMHFQNAHAVQVNLKDLIVAYDGSARWQIENEMIEKYFK